MPLHYALSEILIICAALWCGFKLWRSGYVFAAIGFLLLGLAASIGTIRIFSTPNETLITAHKTVSAFGGLVGMGLIALEFVKVQWPEDQKSKRSFFAMMGILLSLAAAITTPALTAPLILIWAGIATIASFILPASNDKVRFVRAGLVSIILINFVVVRQNPVLGPALSWHLYHIIIGLWILVVTRILSKTS